MQNDRNRIGPKEQSSEIIIRIGGQALEPKGHPEQARQVSQLGLRRPTNDREPSVAPELGLSVPYTHKRVDKFKARQNRSHKRSFEASSWSRRKEAFRTGIIAGTFLGCMCMVLFHQIGVNRGTNVSLDSSPLVTSTSNIDAAPAFAPDEGTNVVLTVPALTVHVLEQGPFRSQAEADKAAGVKLNGITGAVTGTDSYSVWRAVSLTQEGLVNDEQKASKVKVSAKVVTLPTKKIPIVVTSDGPDASQVTHWFSREVSSLLTLTGAAQGEMTVGDAVQSVSNADTSVPPSLPESPSGVLLSLVSIEHKLDSAKKSLTSGDTATAETLVLGAWSELFSLYGQ